MELVTSGYSEQSQGARDEHTDDHGDRQEGDRWAGKDGKLYRRKLVATLTLRGFTQRDIAQQLGVSKTTIVKDQAWNRQQWRERAAEAFEAHVAESLHVLDRIRAIGLTIAEDPTASASARMDALVLLHQNHDRRARLQGLNAPEKLDIGVTVSIEEERERGLRLVKAAQEAREREAG